MTSPKDTLTDRLTKLPAVRASTGFTQRVLARVDEPATFGRSRFNPFVMSAVAVAAIALIAVVMRPTATPKSDNLEAEVAEIRRQHTLLTEELDRLRVRTQRAAPVVYLGGSDQVDYVLDLSPLLLAEPGRAVPASRNSEPGTF